MAKLFPALTPSEIANPGERTVARALIEHLPNRVEVFHGFNWLTRSRAGTIQEGECDFVLLDANHGLLFVEVKGGSLVFDGRQWVRMVRGEERLLNKDPFAQAQRGMYDIVGLVKNQFGRAGDNLPFTYGFAVAFPDCRVDGQLPPSILRELILDAASLRQVDASIRRIFRSFNRAGHRALTGRSVESVRAALFPKYRLIPVMWRKIEDQEERLQRLTDALQGILDILANQTRAAIQGVAGSGKTILALAKAQAIARAGTRTLFLCYNRPLKDWLRNAVSASPGDNLVIENYHGLTDVLCRQAGVRNLCMPNLGGLKFSQVAVLAPGYSSHDWPEQFGAVPATTSFEEWNENKGVLLASWHRFKGLEADAIVTIETPVRNDARERVNRYVARSRAKHLLTVIEVQNA